MDAATQRHSTPAAAAAPVARYAIYKNIHKALRGMLLAALEQVGRLDADDAAARERMKQDVDLLLRALETHLHLENTCLHPALRERAPRDVAGFDREHAHQRNHMAALRDTVGLVGRGGPQAARHAYRLYLELSGFVADNLQHMLEEETALTQALWDHFSDAEIRQLEARLVAAVPPDLAGVYLQWMGQCLNHPERVELMRALRGKAPAVAEAGLELWRQHLAATEWARLTQALAEAPAPAAACV